MQIVTSDQAASFLKDGMTVSASGFGGCCHPEAISAAVGRRFSKDRAPRDLTLLFAASMGDLRTRGMGHFAQEGLVKCVIAGGWRGTPRLAELAWAGKIDAHCWPQGVISQLYRAIAGGQPGVITRIGLGSFMDPLNEGGRLTQTTLTPLVERVVLRGRDWLLYPAFPLDCVLLRGTTADEDGNITLEDEAFPLDMLSMAQAGHNSGGIVIVQVKRIAQRGSLAANDVRIPAKLVDYVVVCEDPAEHGISYVETDNIAYTGRLKLAEHRPQPLPLSVDKVIQRRAYLELRLLDHPTVNLGVGVPAGVGRVAQEEGLGGYTLTVESGVIGGVPAEEGSFGAAINPSAVITQAQQFDFYDGGGLDIAFLGMAEVDVRGVVNVSRFGRTIVGVGGFPHIAQTARKVVYLGAFSAGGPVIEVKGGKLDIVQDGRICKIVDRVAHVSCDPTFGPPDQKRMVMTERAVFEVFDGRLTLVEIAPGIDVRRHLLDRLPPGIGVADQLRPMDGRLFQTAPMQGSAA